METIEFRGSLAGLTAKATKNGTTYSLTIEAYLNGTVAGLLMAQIGDVMNIQVDEPQTRTPLRPAPRGQITLDDALDDGDHALDDEALALVEAE